MVSNEEERFPDTRVAAHNNNNMEEQHGMIQRSPWRLRRRIFFMYGSAFALCLTTMVNQRLITPLYQTQQQIQQQHSLNSDDSASSWIIGDNSSITSVLTSVTTIVNKGNNMNQNNENENKNNTTRQKSNSSSASALFLSSSSSSSQSTKNDTNHMLRIYEGKERVGADRLPQWFHDYSTWHTQSLQDLARHGNFQDYQYMSCCGVSERMKNVMGRQID